VREVFAVRSLVSIGIDAFDATINDDAPDSRFFSWIGQLQWARRLGRAGFESIFRLDTQLTPDTLLPMEQFPIGGPYSVRGYRTDELVRDNGVVASLEFRAPLLHNFAAIGTLELAAFADYGRSWNAKGKTPDPKDLSSVGLAIHWNPLPRLNAQLSWAYAFRDIDQADHDLQDAGINFMVSYNVFSK
jgi:hemolysin activation/secretion protein